MSLTAHRIETAMPAAGPLTLPDLPLPPGQPVEVIVLVRDPAPTFPLRGLPVRYADPAEPVAADEWDAAS